MSSIVPLISAATKPPATDSKTIQKMTSRTMAAVANIFPPTGTRAFALLIPVRMENESVTILFHTAARAASQTSAASRLRPAGAAGLGSDAESGRMQAMGPTRPDGRRRCAGGAGDLDQAREGLAQSDDEEDRAGDREGGDQQRAQHRRIARCEQAEADEERHQPGRQDHQEDVGDRLGLLLRDQQQAS